MRELNAIEQRYKAMGKFAQSVAKNGRLHNHYPTGEGACRKPWQPCETALSTAQFCL